MPSWLMGFDASLQFLLLENELFADVAVIL